MKNQIIKVKQFVIDHRAPIMGIIGLAVGVTLTHRYHLNNQLKRWSLGITDEQLQYMLENPKHVLKYDMKTIGKFDLHRIDLSKLQ